MPETAAGHRPTVNFAEHFSIDVADIADDH